RCLFYMFWKIKKMLVSSTNIKKYRARIVNATVLRLFSLKYNKIEFSFHVKWILKCKNSMIRRE
ncbi:hypothetical protein DVX05_12090, partial [Enterococcus faecium]